MPFYAVARGKETGVFLTWPECQDQITGFRGAVYKKFNTKDEAETFVRERKSHVVDKRKKNESSSKDGEGSTLKANQSINGQIDPVLKQMQGEMKSLQRQLAKLREQFDAYVASYSVPDKGKKREREDDNEDGLLKKLKTVERNEQNLQVDDGFLIVYTDGACEFNGKHGARAGVGVYFGPDHPNNISEPVKGRATNNTAEIQAAARALEQTKKLGYDKVIINTDSQFMINCMTSWLPSWKKNNWKKKDGAEVINKEDLIKLDALTDGLLIKWNHVKAHCGIEGNEVADKLARSGAKSYKAEA